MHSKVLFTLGLNYDQIIIQIKFGMVSHIQLITVCDYNWIIIIIPNNLKGVV